MPLNFIERTQKRNQIYNNYRRETNLTRFEDGSKSRALIDGFLSYQESVEDLIKEEIGRVNPLVANSTFQEYWSTFLGVSKTPPQKVSARADQKIVKLYVEGGTFNDLGTTITFAPGDLSMVGRSRVFSNTTISEQDLTYTNTETISLSPGDSEAFISIEANGFGEIYRLEKGQLLSIDFTDYPSYPSFQLKITNVLPITSGYDGDNEEILSTKLFRSSMHTPFDIVDKVSNILLEIPDVEDYLILPRFSGPGTLDVFVDNSFFTIDGNVLEIVRDRLEIIKSQVFVSAVPRVGITIILTIEFISSLDSDNKITILDQIRDLIYNSISSKGIGESIDFIELANAIKSRFPQIRSFGRSNQYFDEVKVYRSGFIDSRIGAYLDQNKALDVQLYERIFPEIIFPNPIIVREKNA